MNDNVTPVILSALELEVRFGEQIVLNKASLSVHELDRIGFWSERMARGNPLS